MERGRKNRMNIKKQVVRKAVTLSQMMRRRFLFTGASGIDSTTTAGGFPAGLATAFGAGGAAVVAGGTATAEVSSFKLLSTPRRPPPTAAQFSGSRSAHTSTPGDCVEKYTVPRDTGIAVSVKTNLALITRSATVPNSNNKLINFPADAFYTTFAIVLARG